MPHSIASSKNFDIRHYQSLSTATLVSFRASVGSSRVQEVVRPSLLTSILLQSDNSVEDHLVLSRIFVNGKEGRP